MKIVLFILFWLGAAALSFAQNEIEAPALLSQKDTAEVVVTAFPADTLAAYAHTASYSPSILLSSNSYLGSYAAYSAPNILWSKPSAQALPRWLAFSASAEDYPGLMGVESGSVGATGQYGRFFYNAYAGAIKYATFNSLTTSYFVGGEAMFAFNPHLSITVFGAYYSKNPYLGMAAYPYVQTTNFGGYITMRPSSTFSLSLGAKSYYDPFARRMEVDPIIAPTVKVGKVSVGIDFGHAAKGYLRSLFHSLSK